MKINFKVFYKMIRVFLVARARHALITQNKKFPISLQYFKKEGRVEDKFLHADKQQNFQQIDTIDFRGYDQSCSKYSK